MFKIKIFLLQRIDPINMHLMFIFHRKLSQLTD